MREWLLASSERLARAVGEEHSAYAVDEKTVELVLELARISAHDGGDRTNVPVASYLLGLAHARHPDRSLRELIDAASGTSSGG